jgi:hypothetical protein
MDITSGEPKLEKSSRIKKRVRKSLQNDNPSPPLSSMPLTWNASSSVFPPTPTGPSQSYRKRGNKSKSKSTLREEILHLKHLRAKLSTLKTKLEIAKTNAKTAKTLLYAYRTQSLLNQSLESQNQTMNENTRTKVPGMLFFYSLHLRIFSISFNQFLDLIVTIVLSIFKVKTF